MVSSKDKEDFNIPDSTNYKNNPNPKEPAYGGKEIRRWAELNHEDKGKVKLAFLEGTIKGFKFYQVNQYIFAVTKIKIHKSFLYAIKRQHEADNKFWYYHMARDRFAYVSAYRKCIDEIELYKEQLWRLVLSPKESGVVKVAAVKELHNLTKTGVLLLKDLPFVMNLSQHYDPKILDPNHTSLYHLGKSPDTHTPQGERRGLSFLNTERTDGIEKHHTNLAFSTLERIETKHTMNDELTQRLREQTKDVQDHDVNKIVDYDDPSLSSSNDDDDKN